MTKINSCPNCGSKKIKWENPQMSLWKCRNCGYYCSFVIEDENMEKQLKEIKKMEKLSRKLSWRR